MHAHISLIHTQHSPYGLGLLDLYGPIEISDFPTSLYYILQNYTSDYIAKTVDAAHFFNIENACFILVLIKK